MRKESGVGKDGTPVMTASFRHVDLDTHLRSIIKAGSKSQSTIMRKQPRRTRA